MKLFLSHLVLAFAAFFSLVACSPKPEELLLQSKSLLEEGKYEQSIEYLNRAIEQQPEWSEAYNVRAVAYFEQQDFDKAIADFSRAIQLDSSSYKPYYNRGNAYQEQGEYREAIADYTVAILKRPNIKDIYINRGVVLYELKNYQQALEDFNFALKLEEDEPMVLLNRAKTQMALQNWEAAQQDLQKHTQKQPEHAEAFYLLGMAYLQTQQREESCVTWQKAQSLGSEQAQQAIVTYCN